MRNLKNKSNNPKTGKSSCVPVQINSSIVFPFNYLRYLPHTDIHTRTPNNIITFLWRFFAVNLCIFISRRSFFSFIKFTAPPPSVMVVKLIFTRIQFLSLYVSRTRRFSAFYSSYIYFVGLFIVFVFCACLSVLFAASIMFA